MDAHALLPALPRHTYLEMAESVSVGNNTPTYVSTSVPAPRSVVQLRALVVKELICTLACVLFKFKGWNPSVPRV